jgi:uncharacterized protein (TIGR03086 family)
MAERGPGGATALLAGAVRYALTACALVKPAELAAPTPCVEWDVQALLWHLAESVADLEAGLRTGFLEGDGREDPVAALQRREARLTGADPLGALRDRAAGLLYACYSGGPAERFILADGLPLPAGLVACTGAVEIAVHGWDVSAALGRGGAIPPALATRLLALCPLLVAGREGLFAAAVPISPQASQGDRLVGYLGRDPGAPPWARPGNYRPGHDRRAGVGALNGGSGQPPRRLAAP